LLRRSDLRFAIPGKPPTWLSRKAGRQLCVPWRRGPAARSFERELVQDADEDTVTRIAEWEGTAHGPCIPHALRASAIGSLAGSFWDAGGDWGPPIPGFVSPSNKGVASFRGVIRRQCTYLALDRSRGRTTVRRRASQSAALRKNALIDVSESCFSGVRPLRRESTRFDAHVEERMRASTKGETHGSPA